MTRFNVAWVISMVIFIGLGGYIHLYNPTPVPLKIDLSQLPSTIGDWKWVRTEPPKDSFGVQEADAEVMSFYKNTSGREIKLYIGYFKTQQGDKRVTHYRSKWLHKKAEVVEFAMNPAMNPDGKIRINKTIFKDRINNQLLLFWYDMNGEIINSRYKAKIFNTLDGLFRGRTNGAIIIVSKNFENNDSLKEVLRDELEFVREFLPILRNYLPSSS
jgi:EpsI family protein